MKRIAWKQITRGRGSTNVHYSHNGETPICGIAQGAGAQVIEPNPGLPVCVKCLSMISKEWKGSTFTPRRSGEAPTAQEVVGAVARFRQAGGLIRKLPAEDGLSGLRQVGRQHGAYIDVLDRWA